MSNEETAFLSGFIRSFQDREKFLESVTSADGSWSTHIREIVWITVLTAAYGAIMGIYNGSMQALASGVKLPALFLLSILVGWEIGEGFCRENRGFAG